MSAGHTPGPWVVGGEIQTLVLGPKGILIADCGIVTMMDETPSLATCQANARLVAAVHGLVDSLIEMLLAADYPGAKLSGEGGFLDDGRLDRARLAIATAKGPEALADYERVRAADWAEYEASRGTVRTEGSAP